MDPPIDERNRATTARLRELGERLSDEQLLGEIDPPWTGAALFAHIAFWDRFALERWRLAAETGERIPAAVDDALMDRLNDASLPQWLVLPAASAVEGCLDAAAEIDRFVGSLDPATISTLSDRGRGRLADRSIHREEHLGTLEGAFSAS
jgi:DinB superfamily